MELHNPRLMMMESLGAKVVSEEVQRVLSLRCQVTHHQAEELDRCWCEGTVLGEGERHKVGRYRAYVEYLE